MEAAGGVEVPEAGRAAAIALDFSAGEAFSSTPAKVPRRIRWRLLECRSSPPLSAEVIENKLKEADLRRRQFHNWLSRKARSKARSPSWSSQEDDHGQRLEAKLNAAEQKRLNLLAKSQKRLAQLDELRQAAKTGVEMRFEKQREELGSRVESRVQQAEANRVRLLEDHMQRRAAVQERKARSLLQRIARERKHKERICSAISQKRSAAEKKRMVLLEAEKSRAQARVMQARRVAKSVCCQRESERRKMKEQLENRLQRAKRQRAEYLRLRGNLHSSSRVSWTKHADILSRKLARCWRQFVRSRKTTFMLAQAYEALGINKTIIKSMPFEQLAQLIESSTTLQTAKALLDRLESRFLLYQASRTCSSPENIDHLLRHLTSPRKRSPPGKRSRMVARNTSAKAPSSDAGKLSRYPVRAVLCAYMILGHPDAVFSEQGDREVSLSNAALNFVQEFELLIKIILDGANRAFLSKQPLGVVCDDSHNHDHSSVQVSSSKTFRNQLSIFDAVWRSYLYSFVVWKVKDARLLEDDLVRAACQLELSMIQTCKITSEGDIPNLTHDMRAIQKQVTEDQKLLREKVEHLSGNAGLERMETALLDTRSRFFEAKDCKTPLVSHMAQLSPTSGSSSANTMDPVSNEHHIEKRGNTKHVVRSLFGGSSQHRHGTIDTSSSSQSRFNVGSQLPMENEVFVNEILHMGNGTSNYNLESEDIYGSRIKAKVKETMEKAFWDGIMEGMMEESPDYGRIIGLVKEVRDELSEISPYSWKQDIHDSIDLDILSQVMESGIQDSDYLGRILEYALLMQRKFSAPASENELKKTHEKFLDDLLSISQSDGNNKRHFALSMIKGLRFVLEQIQALKTEIYKVNIEMLEPVMKRYAGVDFLQTAFAECYGPPSNAAESLTMTKNWLSPLKAIANEEWNEFSDSFSLLPESHALPPIVDLRTGGNMSLASMTLLSQSNASGGGQLECSGEKLDVLLRLGLLKLACNIEGLTIDSMPETLKLNASRLRTVQSKLQQIIVISTSILVLRQIFISGQLPISPSEMDTLISNSVEGFFNLVDRSSDIGIDEIVDTLASSSGAEEKLQSRKEVIARVLMKSLQNDDEVFKKINRSVYLAFRAILFGGTGPCGRRIAEGILRKVGAAMLIDRLVNAAEVLIIMANVSRQVHEPWYKNLGLKGMN